MIFAGVDDVLALFGRPTPWLATRSKTLSSLIHTPHGLGLSCIVMPVLVYMPASGGEELFPWW